MTTTAVAAAHAEQVRRIMQEEEEMTQYSDSDLTGEWEFKIVRAATLKFRNPVEFAKLLEEEAKFGWTLLEKLDDSRVRFKRHVRDRALDRAASSGEDPYRSIYGASTARQAILIVAGTLLISLVLVGILFVALT